MEKILGNNQIFVSIYHFRSCLVFCPKLLMLDEQKSKNLDKQNTLYEQMCSKTIQLSFSRVRGSRLSQFVLTYENVSL